MCFPLGTSVTVVVPVSTVPVVVVVVALGDDDVVVVAPVKASFSSTS